MKFDDTFLEEVGLSELPESQKQTILTHAREELELRVGEEMSKDLTDDQIAEFEGLIQNDQTVIRKIVGELGIDFREDPLYRQILKKYQVTQGTWEMIGEYLSIKWIQKNRPNYHTIVENVYNALKTEYAKNSASLLAANQA